jgi:hypothetical protein
MPVRLNGSTSGYTQLSAPAVAGNNSIALPTGNGSAFQILRNGATAGSLEYTDKLVSGTAVASTSGTSIDFTGIPSWVKRITVMFSGVSTSGTNPFQVQLGAGSITTTGYQGGQTNFASSTLGTSIETTGFYLSNGASAAAIANGSMVLTTLGSNGWVANGAIFLSNTTRSSIGGGFIALSGTLDRLRIIASSTGSPADTFDAGSINILYE